MMVATMDDPTTPAISLQNVTKRFGSVTAVDAVSLDIREGEFITLLGPSGCGKTTTMRMIAGFEEPDQGQILLRGHDVVSPLREQLIEMAEAATSRQSHHRATTNVGRVLDERDHREPVRGLAIGRVREEADAGRLGERGAVVRVDGASSRHLLG